MNNKGFTLVELMAVIVILGAIMIFAVPTISNAINASRERVTEMNLENIREAARVFGGQIMNCNNNNAMTARSEGGIIFTLTRAPFPTASNSHRVYRDCHKGNWTSSTIATINLTTAQAQALDTSASITRVLNCCDIKSRMEADGFNVTLAYLINNNLLKDNSKCSSTGSGTINIRMVNDEFVITLTGITCTA